MTRQDMVRQELAQPKATEGESLVKRVMLVAWLLFGLTTGAHADCKAEVDQAFSKLRGGKSFRVETTIVNEKEGTLEMTVDYVLPDRMHQRVKLGNSPAQMETIAIGDRVWSTQGQGWTEVPRNFAEAIAGQLKQQMAPPTSPTTKYECLGETEFEGKTYTAYEGKLPAPVEERAKNEPDGAPKPDNVQTIYVDKDTGLPVRNIVTQADTGTRLFDGTFSTPPNLSVTEPG